jgi:quinol monooxygenase YgiN
MIVISLTLHVPPEEMEVFKPVMEALVRASRQEPGVVAYTFAVDIIDPSLVRVFEIYTDRAALDTHTASPHFQAWRPAAATFVRSERWLLETTR